MSTITRMEAEDRRAQLINTGLKLAQTVGWRKVTRSAVAKETKTARSLTNRYFDGGDGFRDALMTAAVERKLVPLVAEGLLYRSKPAMDAPATLRKQAEAYIREKNMSLPRWMTLTEDGVVHAWA